MGRWQGGVRSVSVKMNNIATSVCDRLHTRRQTVVLINHFWPDRMVITDKRRESH